MRTVSLLRKQARPWYQSHVVQTSQRRKHSLLQRVDTQGHHKSQLPKQPARTRFAPSPTGYLHLGSLRTALYNYLLARATNGQFLLRLEDTDQNRVVPGAEERLYEDLRWSGLSWDEGPDRGGPFGPYKQSERLSLYRQHAEILLDQGKAFRCFCSPGDMTAHQTRSLASGSSSGNYPGTCLGIPADVSSQQAARGEPHTIRFKSDIKPLEVHDIVYGRWTKSQPDDHFIIIKSDGFPTYHFANVIDDHFMEITHVIRGAEWLISTPKHAALYKAFGWEPPQFAHVGLLVDSNRQKLSKRSMDIGIDSYKRDHILPPALVNFAALLGWNPGRLPGKGVMTMDDMVKHFSLRYTKGDIVVNPEKLQFFQKKHRQLILHADKPDMAVFNECLIEPMLDMIWATEKARQIQPSGGPMHAHLGDFVASMQSLDSDTARQYIERALKICRTDAATLEDLLQACEFLLWQPSAAPISISSHRIRQSLEALLLHERRVSPADAMEHVTQQFSLLEEWDWTADNLAATLADCVRDVRQLAEGKDNATYQLLRSALVCSHTGPQIVPLMELLGRDETLRRLRAFTLETAHPTEWPSQDRARAHQAQVESP